jgi:AcrR family transcriptional regulator
MKFLEGRVEKMARQIEAAAEPRSAKDERRDAIIAIGQAAFNENGYAGTSMSAIAAKLGGSKGTLYNYFKSKEELFVAVVQKKCEQIETILSDAEIQSGGDFKSALTQFGERFLALILTDEFIATYRLAMAEGGRFPEIGRAIYESGMLQNQRRLGRLLEHAKSDGQMRGDADINVAAEQFFELCTAGLHRRRLFSVTLHPTERDIRQNIANAVTTFLRAYGA